MISKKLNINYSYNIKIYHVWVLINQDLTFAKPNIAVGKIHSFVNNLSTWEMHCLMVILFCKEKAVIEGCKRVF